TKYIIGQGENNKPIVYTNPDANGNAWFVEELKPFNSANKEIMALDSLDTKSKAIFNDYDFGLKFIIEDGVMPSFIVDSTATIILKEYKPNYIKYNSNNFNDGFAVFSENYYEQGWQAYIDGVEAEHIRVNYVLRGMEIPKGNHIIEYKFNPQVIKTGSSIALGSSILLGLLLLGGLFYEFKKK
ncbi:YfhO family protein, partial [bacterium AH-315-P13]|nr:YfhO family protein [bacterium AH-315-P13]